MTVTVDAKAAAATRPDVYEPHHKVRIADEALVSAARLAHRYVPDRQLPDKAIDLMDEATSRLAMELESVPTEIDEVQRRLRQLELAARQLAEETEETAQDRLAEIEEEIRQLSRRGGRLEQPRASDLVDDPSYGRAILLRRHAGPVRVTVFDGGHEWTPRFRSACREFLKALRS